MQQHDVVIAGLGVMGATAWVAAKRGALQLDLTALAAGGGLAQPAGKSGRVGKSVSNRLNMAHWPGPPFGCGGRWRPG